MIDGQILKFSGDLPLLKLTACRYSQLTWKQLVEAWWPLLAGWVPSRFLTRLASLWTGALQVMHLEYFALPLQFSTSCYSSLVNLTSLSNLLNQGKLSVLREKAWNCNVPFLLTFVPLLVVYRYLLHVLYSQLGHCTLRSKTGPWNQRKDTGGDPRLSELQKITMNLQHTAEEQQDGKWEVTGHYRTIPR